MMVVRRSDDVDVVMKPAQRDFLRKQMKEEYYGKIDGNTHKQYTENRAVI